jgi:O-antigen ligase/tetratricopeptide (TPR) repeat protein
LRCRSGAIITIRVYICTHNYDRETVKPYIILPPVLLLIIVLCIMSGGVTPEVRPVAISGGMLIFIIALLVFAFSSPAVLPPVNSLLVPLVLIAAAVAVQSVTPAKISCGIPLLEIVSYSLLAAAIILSSPSPRSIIFFILTLGVWGVIMVGYGLFRRLSIAGEMGNIGATFINRNHFCAFIGMIAPLCLGMGLWGRSRWIRWLSGCFFLVISGGVLLSGSRGGGIAFGVSSVALLLLYFFQRSDKKTRWVSLLLSAGGGLVLIAILIFLTRDTLYPNAGASLNELSIRTRFSIWQSTFEVFLARPWSGWGWGSFQYIYPIFKAPEVWYKVPHAHNELIQVLSEGGLLGFIALAFCYIYSFLCLVRSFRDRNDAIFKSLSAGALGVLLYAFTHSCFDFIFRLPANAFLLAGIIGLGLSISLTRSRPVVVLGRKTAWLICFSVIIVLTGSVFIPIIKYYRSYRIYQQGLEGLSRRQSLSALADFTAAIELVPNKSGYYLSRALTKMQLFDQSGDKIRLFDEIISDLEFGRRINPWDVSIPWHQAKFYHRLTAYSQAEDKFNVALRLDPTNPFIQIDLARLEFDQDQLYSAAEWLRQAAENYPPVGPDCIDMMLAQTSDYRILKRIPPPLAWLHRQLGYKLREKGMWDEAVQEFREAISLNPDDSANWLALGEAELLIGRYNEAADAFKKGISINPDDGYAWSRLGEVSLKMDDKVPALGYFQKAWLCASEGRKYSKRIYLVVKDVEGNDAAREFLSEVSAKIPEWGWPYSAQAEISVEEDDYGRARGEINEALKREPDHPYYNKLKTRIDRKALSINP